MENRTWPPSDRGRGRVDTDRARAHVILNDRTICIAIRRVQRLRPEEGSVLGRPQESQSYVTSAGVRQSQAMAQIEVLGIEA